MVIGSAATIDATDSLDRIFHIHPQAKLVLEGLLLTGGRNRTGTVNLLPDDGKEGGAIYNQGQLNVRRCQFLNNLGGGFSFFLIDTETTVTFGGGGPGGAICNEGRMTMQTCLMKGNASSFFFSRSYGYDGGAIYNLGDCVLYDCEIVDNSTGIGPARNVEPGRKGGSGGGIYNLGTMFLQRCTLARNSTGSGDIGGLSTDGPGIPHLVNGGDGGSGAGIYNAGRLKMNLCTVSGNTAGKGGGPGESFLPGDGGDGGGIFNIGSLSIRSSTICSNTAGKDGSILSGPGGPIPGIRGGNFGEGGGIFNFETATANLENSLIACNSIDSVNAVGLDVDLSGVFHSTGFNLIGDVGGCLGITNGVSGDLAGDGLNPIDPLLDPLQNNGGLTPTHALLLGPALDQGKSFGIRTDQRGKPRPFNDRSIPNAPQGDGSDIGAFELRP